MKKCTDILTDSFWKLDRIVRSGVHSTGCRWNFIPQITYQLLKRFTKDGEWGLDIFPGRGTTAIERVRQRRNAIDFDLSPESVKLASESLSTEENAHGAELRY